MVVFATPDRLDTSSMVSSPRPDSVSRSRAAVSTRSRERTTRGSAAALTPGTWATRPPPRLPSVPSATCAPPSVLTSSLRYRSVAQVPDTKEQPMDFASVRIITDDLDAMVDFYEKVTGISADWLAPVFAELRYPSANLALAHTKTAEVFNN